MLRREGYAVDCAGRCREARRLTAENSYHLIILDIMLPDGSGLDLCSEWRSSGRAGGDDYVTKPFRLAELLSRIRALLRRNRPLLYEKDGLRIDPQTMSAFYREEQLYLTPTEFQLLSALVRNAGRVLTRKILLQTIWDDAGLYIDDNTLSVHISRLREKIGNDRIQTVRGIGYRWAGEDKS